MLWYKRMKNSQLLQLHCFPPHPCFRLDHIEDTRGVQVKEDMTYVSREEMERLQWVKRRKEWMRHDKKREEGMSRWVPGGWKFRKSGLFLRRGTFVFWVVISITSGDPGKRILKADGRRCRFLGLPEGPDSSYLICIKYSWGYGGRVAGGCRL